MIDPGLLKTRLTIQQPIDTPDDQGGVARSWATFATVWASVVPVGARENVQADAAGVTVTHRIILRSNFSLAPDYQFSDGARNYRIVAIRDRDDRRLVEIDAELRT